MFFFLLKFISKDVNLPMHDKINLDPQSPDKLIF